MHYKIKKSIVCPEVSFGIGDNVCFVVGKEEEEEILRGTIRKVTDDFIYLYNGSYKKEIEVKDVRAVFPMGVEK